MAIPNTARDFRAMPRAHATSQCAFTRYLAFSHEGRGTIVLQSEAGLGSRFMIRIQEPMSNDGVVQTERVMTGTA